mmetsp:Transcript_20075/g.38886  ORF Transcript_20075/g.38886 Transcript_20075/m.38886 type:complete len:236 (-) Transcript_20075:303-1010(-)
MRSEASIKCNKPSIFLNHSHDRTRDVQNVFDDGEQQCHQHVGISVVECVVVFGRFGTDDDLATSHHQRIRDSRCHHLRDKPNPKVDASPGISIRTTQLGEPYANHSHYARINSQHQPCCNAPPKRTHTALSVHIPNHPDVVLNNARILLILAFFVLQHHHASVDHIHRKQTQLGTHPSHHPMCDIEKVCTVPTTLSMLPLDDVVDVGFEHGEEHVERAIPQVSLNQLERYSGIHA